MCRTHRAGFHRPRRQLTVGGVGAFDLISRSALLEGLPHVASTGPLGGRRTGRPPHANAVLFSLGEHPALVDGEVVGMS